MSNLVKVKFNPTSLRISTHKRYVKTSRVTVYRVLVICYLHYLILLCIVSCICQILASVNAAWSSTTGFWSRHFQLWPSDFSSSSPSTLIDVPFAVVSMWRGPSGEPEREMLGFEIFPYWSPANLEQFVGAAEEAGIFWTWILYFCNFDKRFWSIRILAN